MATQPLVTGAGYPDLGIVYVLTNAKMPGVVKIGLTRNDDVGQRVKQLYTTGVPVPYEVHYSAKVPDCAKLERVLHQVFDDKRVRNDREFFESDPDLARLIIDLVKIEERQVSDAEQGISVEQRVKIETEKAKRAPGLTFERLGIEIGTTLTLIKDPSITCDVIGPSKVLYQGAEMTPSASALSALHTLGYNWPTASGFDYWTLDGIKLSTLGKALPREGA